MAWKKTKARKIIGSFSDRPQTPQDFEMRNKKGGKSRKSPTMKRMRQKVAISLQPQTDKESPTSMPVKGYGTK